MIKKQILALVSIITITNAADVPQQVSNAEKSAFEQDFKKFTDAKDQCENEWLKAKEQCENNGDCTINEIFQKLSAQKEIYETKMKFIEETIDLRNKMVKFGIEQPYSLERTVRRIIRR